jgi:hypothetical protein
MSLGCGLRPSQVGGSRDRDATHEVLRKGADYVLLSAADVDERMREGTLPIGSELGQRREIAGRELFYVLVPRPHLCKGREKTEPSGI